MFPVDEEAPPAKDSIDGRLLRLIREDGKSVTQRASVAFGVTRQAISQRLKRLIAQKVVEASGKTRAKEYTLVEVRDEALYRLDTGIDEGTVWIQLFLSKLSSVPKASGICHYAFTEIFNNAVDHSEGTEVFVTFVRSAVDLQITVLDNGVGIFHKLQSTYGFASEHEAIVELVKGKLTTDPARHTGWGIFYTSRMCDTFTIMSGNHAFHHMSGGDWHLERRDFVQGTYVYMKIDTDPERTFHDVLKMYSVSDTSALNVTHVPLSLLQYGEEHLISRSQAKLVASRFDFFKEVILDFSGVAHAGQAFIDELFRVWQNLHPDIKLVAINTVPEIDALIAAARGESA